MTWMVCQQHGVQYGTNCPECADTPPAIQGAKLYEPRQRRVIVAVLMFPEVAQAIVDALGPPMKTCTIPKEGCGSCMLIQAIMDGLSQPDPR